MDQKLIPFLLFPSKNSSERKYLEGLKKEGLIYKAGPRLYSSVPKKDLQKVIRTSWAQMVAKLFPDAVLSHRSAIEFTPDKNGIIHLTSNTNRIIHYPGLSLKFHKGPKALSSDHEFMGFKSASLERALLENLSITKKEKSNSGLPIEILEKKLEDILHTKGEVALNQLRDRAKLIAKNHHWMREYEKLALIIGALLGTKDASNLKSKNAISRARGSPYDSDCMEKLESLFAQLQQTSFKELIDHCKGSEHFTHKAFFESYFSNYIEGTTFEITEAEEIIFDQKIPLLRPKDAHDIIGTFSLVSNPNEMRTVPKTADDLAEILLSRHQRLMSERPEVDPGKFKAKPNRAGDTHFVHPDHVLGTLEKAFEFYKALPPGFHRASYIMFLIAEVHPFMDGNGRVARIFMNADLVSANSPTIIIPNVYREDYLLSLRALSRRQRTEPLLKMLKTAHEFSNLDFSNYPKILKTLQSKNWFLEPSDGRIVF